MESIRNPATSLRLGLEVTVVSRTLRVYDRYADDSMIRFGFRCYLFMQYYAEAVCPFVGWVREVLSYWIDYARNRI